MSVYNSSLQAVDSAVTLVQLCNQHNSAAEDPLVWAGCYNVQLFCLDLLGCSQILSIYQNHLASVGMDALLGRSYIHYLC